jgi:hypothetical protein
MMRLETYRATKEEPKNEPSYESNILVLEPKNNYKIKKK